MENQSKYLLNQSLEQSRIIYDPILNDIFNLKLSKTIKSKSITSIFVSIFICFLCLYYLTTNDYLIKSSLILNYVVKSILFIIFVLFLINFFYSSWLFVLNLNKTIENVDLSYDQKQLFGINDSNINGKLRRRHKEPVQIEPDVYQSPKLPYFSLSPIKLNESMQLDTITQKHQKSLLYTTHDEIEDSYLTPNVSIKNFTNDFTVGEDRRNLHDKSMDLRSNQYQIGTKSVPLLGTPKLPTSQSYDQSVKAGLQKHESVNESVDYNTLLTNSLLSIKTEPNESQLLSTESTIEQFWCRKFCLSRFKLDTERENLRKWISLTILKPLVTEIDNINDILCKLGCFDITIGQSSIAQLNNVQQQTNKINLLQTLTKIIPYLELTPTQDYLVKRLKELSVTTCLSEYNWNNGSSSILKSTSGKEWSDYLPTDAHIIMHLFCTYMNSRLLPHPRYPSGQSFQMQFFYKNPLTQTTTNTSPTKIDSVNKKTDDTKLQTKENSQQDFFTNHQQQQQHHLSSLYLYEYKLNPPYYKVVFNKEVYDIQSGRNNLFDAILCFLHIVKTHMNASLGQVRLDSSGVNILGVID